ncbi:butyrophilin subfamily 1 member A1-like [Acipenser oxyrinchus oxyrinchus]|uniref:Butyrophilin subfamily 1 member A1-like n=1 Tax=Acipenser oxyrinchus oxyrinchus TaxID=40147 RepID=A0AAD8CDZ7_ACIOX|nr:butyrophilin subfamily 1 member A1-like [Acipenser oxyrinchus oxyrinchus]
MHLLISRALYIAACIDVWAHRVANSFQLFLILEYCFEKQHICLQLLYLVFSFSGGWRVVGSDQPVIAEPGDDVILPCHISPRLSAVDLEVRWFRERFDRPVHLYLNQRDWLEKQDSDYRGRTALSPLALQRGDISLQLRNLRPSDRGVYTCYADDGSWNEEGQAEVIVAALGTQPSISMDSTQGEQTRLVCRSEGWSPEPEVVWRDRDGNDVSSLSSTTVQRDSQGLLSVSSYIKIKQQSNMFSCLVRSKTPKPDWESKLHISSEYHMFVD